MKNNKTAKYLKYAIGEIVLVMVGILLALQVNNWNTNRLAKANETSILKQLNADLKENYKELTELDSMINESAKAGKNILNHLDNNNTVTDSLKNWIEWFSSSYIFNNANTTYKNLENSTQNVISNDSLRLQITLMYEREFANVHRRELMIYQEYMPNYKKALLKNFKTGPVINNWFKNQTLEINTPINLELLKQNETYKNAHVDLYNFRLLRLQWLRATILELEALIADIENEINNLKH